MRLASHIAFGIATLPTTNILVGQVTNRHVKNWPTWAFDRFTLSRATWQGTWASTGVDYVIVKVSRSWRTYTHNGTNSTAKQWPKHG